VKKIMKKFFSAVLALGLLLSVATGSYALPAAQGGDKVINIQLSEDQIYKGAALGLCGFAAVRFIANMQAGAGVGMLLVNGLGHLGNGLLAMGPGLLHTFQFGLFVGCASGIAYGIDYLSDHMISKKAKSLLESYLE
jgi:hypothetical protein